MKDGESKWEVDVEGRECIEVESSEVEESRREVERGEMKGRRVSFDDEFDLPSSTQSS